MNKPLGIFPKEAIEFINSNGYSLRAQIICPRNYESLERMICFYFYIGVHGPILAALWRHGLQQITSAFVVKEATKEMQQGYGPELIVCFDETSSRIYKDQFLLNNQFVLSISDKDMFDKEWSQYNSNLNTELKLFINKEIREHFFDHLYNIAGISTSLLRSSWLIKGSVDSWSRRGVQ